MSQNSSPSLNRAVLFTPMDDVWRPIDAQGVQEDAWPTSQPEEEEVPSTDAVPPWLIHMVDNEDAPRSENDMDVVEEASSSTSVAPSELQVSIPRSPSSHDVQRALCAPRPAHPMLNIFSHGSITWSMPGRQMGNFDTNHLFSLHVAGLASHISEEELTEHFQRPLFSWTLATGRRRSFLPAPFRVHSARIVLHASQPSRAPYAFVRMHTQADRDRALVEMQHSVLVPRRQPATPLRLSLNPAKPPPLAHYLASLRNAQQEQRRGPPPRRRDMPPIRDVKTWMPRHPPVRPYDPGRPADRCCGRPDCRFLGQTRITVTELHFLEEGYARVKAQENPGLVAALVAAHKVSAFDMKNTTVFIGSLLSLAPDVALDSIFPTLGRVLSVNIPRGQDCGFVQYERKCDAAHAVVYLHKHMTPAHSLRTSWGRLVGEKVAARAAVRAGLKWVEGRQMA